ncbi:MAG: hypothetical protein M1814_002524 [Vezdaea aestivalis]|nr:MAG: hypothetical protein M1814_002524 [Vezdaea aestivalis]
MQNRPIQSNDENNWRATYIERHCKARRVKHWLDAIVEKRTNRISRYEKILMEGDEAKDTLIVELHHEPTAGDGLCRAFHAREILGLLQRSSAITEWRRIDSNPEEYPILLERLMGAFELFMLGEQACNLDQISAMLDEHSIAIQTSVPRFEELSIYDKSMKTLSYLRSQGFSAATDSNYHDLQNNFIGQALLTKNNACLPLISVVIYCAVARRLGVSARPLNFPFHVYAVVSNDGNALDLDSSTQSRRIYLDPARSDEEVAIEDLKTQLRRLSADDSETSELLSTLSLTGLVERTGRNLLQSLRMTPEPGQAAQNLFAPILHPRGTPDRLTVNYCVSWTRLVYSYYAEAENYFLSEPSFRRFLVPIRSRFPSDIVLLDKHIFNRSGDSKTGDVLLGIEDVRTCDLEEPPRKSRPVIDPQHDVQFKVGQVFRHKRYRYLGVVIGWDTECSGDERWIQQMGVDALPRGRSQGFYHTLTTDDSRRYVAEENIEPCSPERPDRSFREAGLYFKRWDVHQGIFISNNREEYPDD